MTSPRPGVCLPCRNYVCKMRSALRVPQFLGSSEMSRRQTRFWVAGLGIIALLLLFGEMTVGHPALAGFTPTPTPTETPTPTPTPTETPTPTPTPTETPVPPPPPPPPETATPTPTPMPLLPEVGGGPALPAWPLLALGLLALVAGWLVKRKG